MLKNCAKGEKAIFTGLEFENRSKTSERVIKERSVTPVREKK